MAAMGITIHGYRLPVVSITYMGNAKTTRHTLLPGEAAELQEVLWRIGDRVRAEHLAALSGQAGPQGGGDAPLAQRGAPDGYPGQQGG